MPSWVFPFHTFQHCHIHADTITFASTCPLGHHLSAQQDMLSLWGLTSSTAVKHSCQLQRILFLKERLQFISFENKRKKMLSFFKRSALTSYGITENVKKLLPSQGDSKAPVLPRAETFLCSRIQRLIVKSCSVLQSTFCIRLRYKSGRSTAQHETSVRVLGRGLSTPTTYRSSSSLPGSWQKRFNPKKTAS